MLVPVKTKMKRNALLLSCILMAVIAPVMAAAANSPLLFGKRLWRETRVGLFQQAIDTRRTSPHLRDQAPRVSFKKRSSKKLALSCPPVFPFSPRSV